MPVQFDAHEVLQIAEQIERNGGKFYRKAEAMFENAPLKKLFSQLAGWELQHEKVFAKMRSDLEGADHERSTEDLIPQARVMAGLAVFGIRSDPEVEIEKDADKQEVLRLALEKERDSVVFYTGLKGFVPDQAAREQVESIIHEEMRHIRIINEAMTSI